MATYATQSLTVNGVTPTLQAVSASDNFAPADRTFLWVNNGSASAVTVTILDPNTVDGLTISSRTASVPAGALMMFTVPPGDYRNPTTGLATVQYSAITTVTAAVVNL